MTGLRDETGLFPCGCSSLFERLWTCAPHTPSAATRLTAGVNGGNMSAEKTTRDDYLMKVEKKNRRRECRSSDGRYRKQEKGRFSEITPSSANLTFLRSY